jgi:peptidyl-tRNA hydrolase, PTH1 family
MEKYLFIGLGNPGNEYAHTRHNIGFDALDLWAQQLKTSFQTARLGDVAHAKIKGKAVVLLKPNTFMNLSGKAMQYWMTAEKVPLERTLVITDDLALPLGKLRLKMKGSDGGHNGLAHIISTLKTQDFPRLRFGIGNQFQKGKQVDFVLGTWEEEEKALVKFTLERLTQGLQQFMFQGPEKTMNLVNTDSPPISNP